MSEPDVWIAIDRSRVEVKKSIDTAGGDTVYLEEFFKFKGLTSPTPTIEVTDQ